MVTFITVAVTGRGVLWTPTIHHLSSATNHESPTCDWDQADDHWQVPQHGVPPFSDSQVPILTLTPSSSLSHRLEGPIKNSGVSFLFVCVSACGPVYK